MRQHLGARRGNYMMTLPFFVPVMVGFAALSVDISYINMAETQVQHVADAASHAAFVAFRASNSTATGDLAALHILDNNLVGNEKAKLSQAIEYGEWDFDNLNLDTGSIFINAARARVARDTLNNNSLDLFFAPLLGFNTADVRALGVTAGRTRQLMIVQDVSGSFGYEWFRCGEDNERWCKSYSGIDINNSRDASLAFIDYMNTNPLPRDKLGMSMFGGAAWYPDVYDLSLLELNYSNMRAEFDKLDVCDRLPPAMEGTPTPGCGTSQARGLIKAREQFRDNGNYREFQAVIIISDGNPTRGLEDAPDTSYPQLANASSEAIAAANQIWGEDLDGNDARDWNYPAYGCGDDNDPIGAGVYAGDDSVCTVTQRDTTFHGGVHMWSVYFDQTGNQATKDFMDLNMVKGMGRSYVTTDSAELAQIMVEIASSIPVVLAD